MGARGTCLQIVRYSVENALKVVQEGGRIQRMAKGHAEVLDCERRCVGYLTAKDYAAMRSTTTRRAKDSDGR